jgi:hypothetical protein
MSEHQPMRSAPRIVTALLALVALVCAGCGGSATSTTQRTVTRTVTEPATTTQTTGTGGSATGTASTSTTAAIPPCTASKLALLYQGSNGAAGSLALYFALRNTSTAPCHTYGYPGVLFLAKSGASLPTNATRTTHDPLGAIPVAPIVIEPGRIAGFRVVANLLGESGSGAGCTTAYGLQAIAPDDTAPMRTTIPHGVPWCKLATVTPLRLGSAVPPGT